MHRIANARTVVRQVILVLALAGAASAGLTFALAGDADAEKQAAQERKEKYETWMREFAEGTRIRIRSPGVTENEAQVVARPIFRYSGDNIHADDATLWVWTHQARPVAFQKIEVNNIPHILVRDLETRRRESLIRAGRPDVRSDSGRLDVLLHASRFRLTFIAPDSAAERIEY